MEYLALYISELKLLDFLSEFLGSVYVSFFSFSMFNRCDCLFANRGVHNLSGFSCIHGHTFFTLLCLLINVQEEIEAPMWVDFTVEEKSNYQDV